MISSCLSWRGALAWTGLSKRLMQSTSPSLIPYWMRPWEPYLIWLVRSSHSPGMPVIIVLIDYSHVGHPSCWSEPAHFGKSTILDVLMMIGNSGSLWILNRPNVLINHNCRPGDINLSFERWIWRALQKQPRKGAGYVPFRSYWRSDCTRQCPWVFISGALQRRLDNITLDVTLVITMPCLMYL